MRILTLSLLSLLTATAAVCQTTSPGSIQATGTATINAQPDQVQLYIGVNTVAKTAAAAGQQNATQTSAMIAALNQVLGKSGTLQTTGYSIYPNYSSSGGQSTITGYTAQNNLLVTAFDLTLSGPLIDAANAAGASTVSGLTFGLQNAEPSRQQALTQAGKVALSHAAAIAAGLGAKAGAVISAQEGDSISVVPVVGNAAGASSTPVMSGTVAISATVTITVQLSQ